MSKIENTTQTVQDSPLIELLMSDPTGIVASEARGQRQLVESELLPAKMQGDREAMESLGFRFGEPVEGDPLFLYATLPEGWKKQGTDHNLWSNIVDERGLARVSIFYKAAWYDREAFMSLCCVGGNLATEALYGDAAVTRESLKLDLLTEGEVAEFRQGLERMRGQIAECPDIYGKYRKRLAEAEALLS